MKLHVCGLSFCRSLVLVTVLHFEILQFVDLAPELALFAQPDHKERDYPDNQHNQEGKSIWDYAPFPRRNRRQRLESLIFGMFLRLEGSRAGRYLKSRFSGTAVKPRRLPSKATSI
jgi:hypothetical protein